MATFSDLSLASPSNQTNSNQFDLMMMRIDHSPTNSPLKVSLLMMLKHDSTDKDLAEEQSHLDEPLRVGEDEREEGECCDRRQLEVGAGLGGGDGAEKSQRYGDHQDGFFVNVPEIIRTLIEKLKFEPIGALKAKSVFCFLLDDSCRG